MANDLKDFEIAHRLLAAHAARRQDTSEMQRHLEACTAAINAMRAGETDATLFWEAWPATLNISLPDNTGVEVDGKSDGTDDPLFVETDPGPPEADRIETIDGLFGNDTDGSPPEDIG